MQANFEEYVIGELQRIIGPGSKLLKTRILNVFGMTESAIEEVLGRINEEC